MNIWGIQRDFLEIPVVFVSDDNYSGTMRETESFYYNKKKHYIDITPDDDAKIVDISDLKG